jgi:hypothetical protein
MSRAGGRTALLTAALPWTVSLSLVVALSASDAGAATEEGCDSLGHDYKQLVQEELGLVCEKCREEEVFRRRGRLFGTSGAWPALCPVGGELGKNCSPLDMTLLGALFIEDVVRQWNGDLVEVSALPGRSGDVPLKIRLLNRGASPAFCRGYEGPLEPAPAEDDYDTAWQKGRFGQQLADGTGVRLHSYKAIVGLFPQEWEDETVPKETVAFEVPEPYLGRDIISFSAFSRGQFVFRLSDARVYSWNEGELQEIAENEGQILEVALGGDGNLYLWVGRDRDELEEPKGRWWDQFAWNAIRCVTPDLEVTTIWESTSHVKVTRLTWEDGGLPLTLRRIRSKHQIMLCPDSREVGPSDGAAAYSP